MRINRINGYILGFFEQMDLELLGPRRNFLSTKTMVHKEKWLEALACTNVLVTCTSTQIKLLCKVLWIFSQMTETTTVLFSKIKISSIHRVLSIWVYSTFHKHGFHNSLLSINLSVKSSLDAQTFVDRVYMK